MSFWTKLFGAENIINKVSDGADAAFFTPEERSRHYIDVLKNIEPFKVAQRWFALVVILSYVCVWLACASVFLLSGAFDGVKADQLIEISKALAEQNNENLGVPVTIIVTFYFGGGFVEGAIERFKKKSRRG